MCPSCRRRTTRVTRGGHECLCPPPSDNPATITGPAAVVAAQAGNLDSGSRHRVRGPNHTRVTAGGHVEFCPRSERQSPAPPRLSLRRRAIWTVARAIVLGARITAGHTMR
jgi:hypothetical protein